MDLFSVKFLDSETIKEGEAGEEEDSEESEL